MSTLRLTLPLLATIISVTHGYSSGGPDSACDSMMPRHGVAAKTSGAPYTVTTPKKSVMPGETIDVTIQKSPTGPAFLGFFLRATQGTKFLTGQFTQNAMVKLRCTNQAVTHAGPTPKSSMTVSWTVPAQLSSSVPFRFVATVVQVRQSFWMNISSDDIMVSTGSTTGGTTIGGGNMGGQGGSTAPTTNNNNNNFNKQHNHAHNDDDDDDENGGTVFKNPGSVIVDPDCGKVKGCFHNCEMETGPCSYVISWKDEGETVFFKFLYRTTSTTDQWIALGLSHDQHMGDDSVMECVMDQGRVLVKTSYNTGKYNDYPDDKHAGMADYVGSVQDGVIACQFRRKKAYPREHRVFDLHKSYYFMVAHGEAVSGNKFAHSYTKLPQVSAQKIDIRQVGTVHQGLDPLYPMVKTHGTAMTLAWMFFASSGMFIARHGRSMMNSAKPCGILVWFHIHRFSMGMTAFLTAAGFILILVESHGYSHIPDTPGKGYRILHPPLGLILIILTMVNPMMALFRPDKDSPQRPLFNWTHWGCGMFAWILSLVLLVIGLDLRKSQADVEGIYAVFAFLAYQLVAEILIRVLPYAIAALVSCMCGGCCRPSNSYDLNMAEIRNNEFIPPVLGASEMASKESQTQRERTRNCVHSTLLVFHMVFSACFAIAVLYYFLRRPLQSLDSFYEEKKR